MAALMLAYMAEYGWKLNKSPFKSLNLNITLPPQRVNALILLPNNEKHEQKLG